MATKIPTEGRILLFSADDDIDNHRRARVLESKLTQDGVACQLVNKLSTVLTDVLLVAKHRVLEVPSWILIDAAGAAASELHSGMPSVREMRSLLGCD